MPLSPLFPPVLSDTSSAESSTALPIARSLSSASVDSLTTKHLQFTCRSKIIQKTPKTSAISLYLIINDLQNQLANSHHRYCPKLYCKYLIEQLTNFQEKVDLEEIALLLRQYGWMQLIISNATKREIDYIVKANFILALDGLTLEEMKKLLQRGFTNHQIGFKSIAASQPLYPFLRVDFLVALNHFFAGKKQICSFYNDENYSAQYLSLTNIHPAYRAAEIDFMNRFVFSSKSIPSILKPCDMNPVFSAFVLFKDYWNCLELMPQSSVGNFRKFESLLKSLYCCCYQQEDNQIYLFLFNQLFNWKQQITTYTEAEKIIQPAVDMLDNQENVEEITAAKVFFLVVYDPNAPMLRSGQINFIGMYFDQIYHWLWAKTTALDACMI